MSSPNEILFALYKSRLLSSILLSIYWAILALKILPQRLWLISLSIKSSAYVFILVNPLHICCY